jgi:adenylate kinase family enzyme
LRRVLVIGSGGSGKTTFARRLAERTGLPLIHLDALYWRPGWDPTPAEEWRAKVAELLRAERWIMDGNYGGTLDVRLEACDTVIFLDVPRWLCLWRVVKRQLQHRRGVRPEMAPGCPERLTWEFVEWIWTYPARRRASILARLKTLGSGKQPYVLRSAREIESFLDRV